MSDTSPRQATAEAITVDQLEAARLTGLSAKSLERRALEGEPVGRVKIGRRVVFHLSTLERWLASKANPVASSTN